MSDKTVKFPDEVERDWLHFVALADSLLPKIGISKEVRKDLFEWFKPRYENFILRKTHVDIYLPQNLSQDQREAVRRSVEEAYNTRFQEARRLNNQLLGELIVVKCLESMHAKALSQRGA